MSFYFHDYQPESEDLQSAVLHGLAQSPKALHPKFFYDEVGSQIFNQICDQPEYYVPRLERQILEENAKELVQCLGEGCHLIEPGAGSGIKVRFLLDRVNAALYAPMDISSEHLKHSAQRLSDDYPELPIHAVCVDHTKQYELPAEIPKDKRVFFYPGSSLGNFSPRDAIAFLQGLRDKAGESGGLLIGIDTKKPSHVLNAAYNDAAGATAAFNLNVLVRLQEELGAKIDLNGFQHHAFYNEQKGRIEMHLKSVWKQQIDIKGQSFQLQAGESIHTENSYKYTPEEFQILAWEAGWKSEKLWLDSQAYFSVHFLRVR